MRYALVFVTMLLFITGCVQQEGVKTFDGIRINKFIIDPPRVREGGKFIVSLEIENVGTVTARNVVIDLYGLSWIPEIYKGWLTYGYDVGYIDDGIPGITMRGIDVRTSPPSPGDVKNVEWEIPAPDYPEGIVHTHIITARVTYDYSTKTVITIPVISQEEYERKFKGKGLGLEPTIVSNTASPVQVFIEGVSPIIVDEYNPLYPEDIETTQTFRIIFKNTGSGIPSSLVYDTLTGEMKYEDGFIYGTVRIEGPGYFVDCLGISSSALETFFNSNVITFSGLRGSGRHVFQLFYSTPDITIFIKYPTFIDFDIFRYILTPVRLTTDEVVKSCTIGINKLQWGDRKEDSISLIFDLYYTYYVEGKAQVTTIGRGPQTPIEKFFPLMPQWARGWAYGWTYSYVIDNTINPFWKQRIPSYITNNIIDYPSLLSRRYHPVSKV